MFTRVSQPTFLQGGVKRFLPKAKPTNTKRSYVVHITFDVHFSALPKLLPDEAERFNNGEDLHVPQLYTLEWFLPGTEWEQPESEEATATSQPGISDKSYTTTVQSSTTTEIPSILVQTRKTKQAKTTTVRSGSRTKKSNETEAAFGSFDRKIG